MDNCSIDCIQIVGNYSRSTTCDFVTNNCIQDTVNFVKDYYCTFNASFVMLFIISVVLMVLVYYALNIATDDYLAPCLEEFIIKLNMSQALAGITFLALANGAPDIITAVVAGTSSSDTTVLIPFGSLYGAALFGMGFILATVIKNSPEKELKLNQREVIIPIGFYLAGTLYLLLISAFYQKMNIYIAVSFFSFYLIYIIFVVYDERKKKNKKQPKDERSIMSESASQSQGQRKKEEEEIAKPSGSKSFGQEMDEVYNDINKEQEQKAKQHSTRLMGRIIQSVRTAWIFIFNYSIPVILKDKPKHKQLISALLLSTVVMWIAKGIPDVFKDTFLGMTQAIWFAIPSLVLLAYTIFTLVRGKSLYFTTIFNIYAFVVIVTWITFIVNVLINLMQLLQLLTNINSIFLGLTVFAWANSIGDYLSITTFAKRGYCSTAVAGIFSGQLLNFLIGFGVALMINSFSGEYEFNIFNISGKTYDVLSDMIILVVIGLSFIYMVILSVIVVLKRGLLQNPQANFAKIYYISFVVIALLISILTDFFRQLSCDL